MRVAQEEIFGPTTALIPVKDVDEAIRVSNGIEFGLSSSIFTRDVNTAFRAMRDLEAGITYINAGTIGAEVHLPFGGVKGTGNGHREAGQAALDVFTEWKSIYVDYSGKLQRAQIDTGRVAPPLEPETRRLRPARGARPAARGAVRRRRRPDRRLRALLLVHGGDGHVPRGRGLVAERGPAGARAAALRAAAGDGLSRGARDGGRRSAARAHPYEEPAFDLYRARCEGAASTDGGSRGNPGPAAYGYVLEAEDGTVLDARGEAIGTATNNVAEYRGLLAGLEAALERGVDEVEVVSDSELLVKQMRGEYKVKNETLRELVDDAEALARRLKRVTLHGRAPRAQRAGRPARQRSARFGGLEPRLYFSRSRGCSSVG